MRLPSGDGADDAREEANRQPRRSPRVFGILFQRNFWPYALGNLASQTGTWVQVIAQSIVSYDLTGSTFIVGVVNGAHFAGFLVLAPWSGSAADRFDRRHLLFVVQAVAAGASGALAVLSALDLLTVVSLVGLAGLIGLATAMSTPAVHSLIPSLVPRNDLARAVMINSLTFTVARAIGPVAGGLVVGQFGASTAFAVNGLSYGVFIVGVSSVTPLYAPARAKHISARSTHLRASIRIVRADRTLVVLLVVAATISFSMDPLTTLTPALVGDVFEAPESLVGILVGGFGAGSIAAALMTDRPVGEHLRLLPVSCAVFGCGMAGYGLAPGPLVAFGLLAIAGTGFVLSASTTTSLLHLTIEDDHRGRIMALWSVCFLGIRPVAAFIDGALAQAIGVRPAAVSMALPTLAMSGALALFVRHVSRPAADQQPEWHRGDLLQ